MDGQQSLTEVENKEVILCMGRMPCQSETRMSLTDQDVCIANKDCSKTSGNTHHSRAAAGAHKDCGHLFYFSRVTEQE